ncbi:MAG: ABC transporter permease [Chloroflexota bacterium]
MISALFRPSPIVFILVLALLGWTGTMRLVRGETISLREREYIIAARAMGASDIRIMFQHIMPNLISIVIISLAIQIGGLILTESALSYLGFGINPPTPTWGNMLSDAQSFYDRSAYLVYGPGLLISITVLCLYVIGDGLRDAFDPTAVD